MCNNIMNVIKFDTLDIPDDIKISLHDCNLYYIFYDMTEDIHFRLFIENNLLTRYNCNEYGILKQSSSIIINNELDVNNYLWSISTQKYNIRFIKLELIERLRNINDVNQIKKIIEHLKINYVSIEDNNI